MPPLLVLALRDLFLSLGNVKSGLISLVCYMDFSLAYLLLKSQLLFFFIELK